MTEDKLLRQLAGYFKGILFSIAVAYLLIYCVIAFLRLNYPFGLEWEEGDSVNHVIRILSGHKMYVSPSLDFIPHTYTPLYYYLSAMVSGVLDAGFFPLRLVSVISSIGCFFMIFTFVNQETKSRLSGLIACGLFAATFRLSGAWFDIARVDSLFLLLLLASLYFIRFKRTNISYVLAGLLISLSFLTKQTALTVWLPMILFTLISDWRRSLYFIFTSVMIIGVSTLFLDYLHDGWYSYYVFELPSNFSQRVDVSRFMAFWVRDIYLPFKIAVAMSACYFLKLLTSSKKDDLLFYFLLAGGMFGGSLAPRMQPGGIENVLIPAYTMIAILFGLSFHMLTKFADDMSSNKRYIFFIFVCILCILQFTSGYLRYDPYHQVPGLEDREAGNNVIESIVEIDGDVFIPSQAYLTVISGKRGFAHQKGIRDNLLHGSDNVRNTLAAELIETFQRKGFAAVILGSAEESWISDETEVFFKQNYIRSDELSYAGDSFIPIAGLKTRPAAIYIPR